MGVKVLRLGHRPERDKRVSTHCGLVARAFGAKGMLYTGEKDPKLEASIQKVSAKWGGKFVLGHRASFGQALKGYRGKVLHLSMYGLPVGKVIGKVRKARDLLVVVGAEKVPREVYERADWNVSVTQQPHSEIAALAVFLHEYFRGKELKFPGALLTIVPQGRGKLVKSRKAKAK